MAPSTINFTMDPGRSGVVRQVRPARDRLQRSSHSHGRGRLARHRVRLEREKIYITNSGYNRVEVFDIASQQFTTPLPVGQLPHAMALGLDGSTLYVANTTGNTVTWP